MKNFLKRTGLLIMCMLLVFTVSACGKRGNVDDIGTLPDIDRTEKVTLSIWVPREGWAATSTYDQNDCYKKVAEVLNLDLNFIHPSIGSEFESFSTMILDKKLPDIIIPGTWYPGGSHYGVQHKIFKDINPYVEKYAPDYWRILQERSDIKKEVVDDNGKISAIYGFSEEEEYMYSGPIWNKRALTKLGEEVPETIADWERVLARCHDELNMEAPLALHPYAVQELENAIISAFNVDSDFYIDSVTGKVKFGPMEQGYLDYINLIKKWYDDGLISMDFTGATWELMITNFKNDNTAVLFDNPANAGTLYGEYKVDWEEGLIPVMHKGDKLTFRNKLWFAGNHNGTSNAAASISRDCKHVDRALDFLNYGFTKEGKLLYNYGTEGKTYNIDKETGKPVFTDIWFNSDEGSTMDLLYKFKVHNGVFIRDERYANPTVAKNPYMTEIMKRWTAQGTTESILPPITYTNDEQNMLTTYLTDIRTLVGEQRLKYIKGEVSLHGEKAEMNSKFHTTLQSIGVDYCTKIVQQGYDRYLRRG